MAYSRFGDGSRWYIYWADGPESCADEERLEVLNSEQGTSPVGVTYREAKALASEADLSRFGPASPGDEAILRAAFTEFTADVEAHHASPHRDSSNPSLIEEAEKATQMLRRKSVGLVRRPRNSEIVLEFTDGTRLLVHTRNGDLELSIEGLSDGAA